MTGTRSRRLRVGWVLDPMVRVGAVCAEIAAAQLTGADQIVAGRQCQVVVRTSPGRALHEQWRLIRRLKLLEVTPLSTTITPPVSAEVR